MSAEGQDATIHEFPSSHGDITDRQRRILEAIRDSVTTRGYPPSMREIGEVVGLTSSSSVKHQLTALQAKGFLRQDPNRPRALEVVMPEDDADIVSLARASHAMTVDDDRVVHVL